MRNLLFVFIVCSIVFIPSVAFAQSPRLDCTVSQADMAVDSEESQTLVLVNQYRQQLGLGTLTRSISLTRSTAWHVRDMATKHYLAHKDSLGRDSGWRMNDCGSSMYAWRGENAGFGQRNAAEIVSDWKASAGHNALLTDPKYVSAGVSRAQDTINGGWYWSMDVSSFYDDPNPIPTSTVTSTPTATPIRTFTPTVTTTRTVTANPRVERLVNGGFEQGISGWNYPSWLSSSISVHGAQPVHSGTQALRVSGRASGVVVQQSVPVTSGEVVYISGWINVLNSQQGMTGAVELVALNSRGGQIIMHPIQSMNTSTVGWRPVTTSIVVPNGATTLQLRFRLPTLNGTILLDDWSVK